MDFDLLLQVALKLFMAFLLGGLVGYEREHHSRPAGLRTHILVCMGAALVQITALDFYLKNKGTFATDPMRLGAQVISGIGFLGAGTILKEGANIKGLTTAAGIWTVACIGLAVGSGLFMEAMMATLFMFLALRGVKKFERKTSKEKKLKQLKVIVKDSPGKLGEIGSVLGKLGIQINGVEMHTINEEYVEIDLLINSLFAVKNEGILEKIASIKDVKEVNILNYE